MEERNEKQKRKKKKEKTGSGRRIPDVIGLAQEFTNSFNCKSTSRRTCITIDFSKAFDTLRWDAIDATMELMGIDETF